jgi:hypothetical protein
MLLMRKLFYTAATAAALALSSTAANASLVLSPVSAPGPTIVVPASGTFTQTFGNAGDPPASPGHFTNVFNFTLNTGALGNAFLGSIALNGGNNIDFNCPDFCQILFDTTPFIPGTSVVNGQNLDTFTLNPLLISGGQHSITVRGNIVSGPTASYTGTFNFQNVPVPEPAAWALMLLGFFGIGIVMRSRRPSTVPALA